MATPPGWSLGRDHRGFPHIPSGPGQSKDGRDTQGDVSLHRVRAGAAVGVLAGGSSCVFQKASFVLDKIHQGSQAIVVCDFNPALRRQRQLDLLRV